MTDRGKNKKTNEISTVADIISGKNGNRVIVAVTLVLGVCVISITGTNLYAISKGYNSTLSLFNINLILSHVS